MSPIHMALVKEPLPWPLGLVPGALVAPAPTAGPKQHHEAWSKCCFYLFIFQGLLLLFMAVVISLIKKRSNLRNDFT